MAIDNSLSALLPDAPPPRPARRGGGLAIAGSPAPVRRRRAANPGRGARPQPGAQRLGPAADRGPPWRAVALVVLVRMPDLVGARDELAPQASPERGDGPGSRRSRRPFQQRRSNRPTRHWRQSTDAAPPGQANRHSAPADPPAAPTTATLAEPAASASAAPRGQVGTQLAATVRAAALPADSPGRCPRAPAKVLGASGRQSGTRAASTAATSALAPAPRHQRPVLPPRRIPVRSPSPAAASPGSDWPAIQQSAAIDGFLAGRRRLEHLHAARPARRDLAACRAFADPSAPGATGRAGAQLADGLTLAWQGELGRAIDAFDRAIRLASTSRSPTSTAASLGRPRAICAGDGRFRPRHATRPTCSAATSSATAPPVRARPRAGADQPGALALDPGYAAVPRRTARTQRRGAGSASTGPSIDSRSSSNFSLTERRTRARCCARP